MEYEKKKMRIGGIVEDVRGRIKGLGVDTEE